MKLIGSLTSPYVRKVRIVLNEKKIEHEFVVDSPWEPGSDVASLNPLGKVPVLITDDGLTLYDSAVIVDFLEAATPNSRLLPQPNRIRATVKCLEALAGGTCDAGASIIIENKMHSPDTVSEELLKRNFNKICLAVEKMSADLGTKDYFIENNYGLGDIAVGCALAFVDRLNHEKLIDLPWREMYPNLDAYMNKLDTRPSFIETAPPKQ